MSLTVTTPIGDLEIVFPNGRCASVSTPGGRPVRLGVSDYSVSARFDLADDGQWVHAPERLSDVLRPWDMIRKAVPPTFEKRAIDAARWAIETAVSQDPGVLIEAALWQAQYARDRASEKAAKLRAELAEADAELADAEAVLLAAQSAHQN